MTRRPLSGCWFCLKARPSDVEAAINEGWIPSFYCGQTEYTHPVCAKCARTYLRYGAVGEYVTTDAGSFKVLQSEGRTIGRVN